MGALGDLILHQYDLPDFVLLQVSHVCRLSRGR
jgi:hypothetical protein